LGYAGQGRAEYVIADTIRENGYKLEMMLFTHHTEFRRPHRLVLLSNIRERQLAPFTVPSRLVVGWPTGGGSQVFGRTRDANLSIAKGLLTAANLPGQKAREFRPSAIQIKLTCVNFEARMRDV
jgi:hypothetical protein